MKRILLSIVFVCVYSFVFSQIGLYVTRQNVSCQGMCDGGATAVFSGGTGPYTYTWQPSGYVGSNITNLCIGQYTVYAEDAVGNTSSSSISVNEPSVQISTYNTCSGLCSANVVASAFNATPPYSYLWSNSTSTQTLSLCTGNYSVQVTDANGCIITQTASVLSPPQMTVNITQTNASCAGLCNGSANINVSGGSGYFKYEFWFGWGFPTTTLTATPSNLCSNAYTLSVTDTVTGCQKFEYFYISQAGSTTIPNTTITSTSQNESCLAVGNGSIDVTITGSNPGPFTYLWSNNASTQDLNNIVSGNYWVTISDASSNCTTLYDTINAINLIPNAAVTFNHIDETCLNSADGFIDVTVSGTNPGPFTYLWNTGTATQDIYNIPSGTYSLTITDNNANCVVISDTIHSIGINCGCSISGHVYIDNDGSCSFNSGDGNSIYSAISIQPGNRSAYADYSGNFTISNLPYGTYSVSLVSAGFIYMSPACGTTLNINVNSSSPNSINNELPVGFSSTTQPDVYVGAFSNGIVPGFASHVTYNLGNFNNVSAAGKLKITLPSNYTSAITTVSPSAYSISGDTVIWNFSNVSYYNSIWPQYGTNYSVEFITPITEPLGSTFTSSIFAQPTVTDLNNLNNITYYQRLVTGSFDPNAKTVSPTGNGVNGAIYASETDLTYLIQFQNTGNGPAVNVIVKDTVSSNLDINTLEILRASHAYNVDVMQGNVLRWKFNNIMLPDSNSNEPASHGYIQYRIKRTNNNTPGTQIKNTAYIYFDFNAPVVTNTTLNTIELFAGIASFSKDNELTVYPNPTNSILTIDDKRKQLQNATIEIKNYLGQDVFSIPFANQINLSGLSAGMYFLTLRDKENKRTVKVIKE